MKKILLFTIIINLSSCGYFYNIHNNSQEQSYIRIVDSKGKPKKVRTFTPELNIQYLTAQESQKFRSNTTTRVQNPAINERYNSSRIENNLMSNDGRKETQETKINKQTQQKVPNQNNNKLETKEQINKKSQNDQEPAAIIYKLDKEELSKYDLKPNKAKKSKIKPSGSKLKRGDLLIQISSFANKRKALRAKKQKNVRNSRVISVKIGKKTYHKLVVGPFRNKKQGNITLKKLKKLGYNDAFYYKYKG